MEIVGRQSNPFKQELILVFGYIEFRIRRIRRFSLRLSHTNRSMALRAYKSNRFYWGTSLIINSDREYHNGIRNNSDGSLDFCEQATYFELVDKVFNEKEEKIVFQDNIFCYIKRLTVIFTREKETEC